MQVPLQAPLVVLQMQAQGEAVVVEHNLYAHDVHCQPTIVASCGLYSSWIAAPRGLQCSQRKVVHGGNAEV